MNRSRAIALLTILNEAMESNEELFEQTWDQLSEEIRELIDKPEFEAIARVGKTGVCTFFTNPVPGSYLYPEAQTKEININRNKFKEEFKRFYHATLDDKFSEEGLLSSYISGIERLLK